MAWELDGNVSRATGAGRRWRSASGRKKLSGLLPSVGRIIGKLDFYDATIIVTQPGPETNSWVRHSVTLIQPPAAPEDSDAAATEEKDAVEKQ